MTIRQYLMKACQDDARRAGERDRLLLEARRARRARRERPDPAALGPRMAASRPAGPQHRRFPAPITVGVALVLAVIAALIVIAVWRGLAPGPAGHRTGTPIVVPHPPPGPSGS